MQDTLLALVDDFKVFVMAGIQTLPLTMAGTLLVLGFGTANYPMLFFLVGMLVVAPIVPFFVNLMFANESWRATGCGIVPGQDKYILSQWIVMVNFFLGYMMTNAVKLYQLPAVEPADPQKTALRQSQCTMGMIVIALCMIVFFIIRVLGCDSGGRMALAVFAAIWGIGLGVGWYYLLNTSASGRLADLFGIANRLLSPSAFVNEPVGCVPVA
jgi:hypothetical protein